MSSNLSVNSINMKDDLGNLMVITGEDFLGGIIQTVSAASDVSYGTIAHASPFAITSVDVSLTAKGTNSEFLIMSRYAADDTNSGSFGVGIGSMYSIDDGTTFHYITYPAAHEDYQSGSYNTYMVARMRRMTHGEIQVEAGTTIIFRVMGRFNNSNGQWFAGNGLPYNPVEQIVQEIKADV